MGPWSSPSTLFDGIFQFLRRRPLQFWRLPGWLLKGKAHLKTEVARAAPLDAARLPYNTKLLHFLQAERREGREIYLATGADGGLATRVAEHLGIFAGVLATDRSHNLTHTRKLERLKERFGAFDYIGNSRADLPLLANAGQAMLANPTPALRMAIRLRHIPVAQTFVDHRPLGRTVLKAIRVHQWAKNILLFVPLLLSHQLSARALVAVVAAFLCFSFMASANYLINDLLDIESDRRHPSKRHRPFASGDLSVAAGIGLALALFAGALAILPPAPRSLCLLGGDIHRRHRGLFPLPEAAGGDRCPVAVGPLYVADAGRRSGDGTEISHWLAGFSTFLFLSLAMVKRFSELENLRERGAVSTHGRGYLVADLEQIRSFGTASGYAAVVVFMLYIARPDVTTLYRYAGRLWLLVPLLLYWITRIWLLASRGELDDDPVIFAIRDRMSLLVGLGILVVAWLAI